MEIYFKELFAYNHYTNMQLWEAMMNDGDSTPEKSLKLFNHILNAHQIWNNRINPQIIPVGVWERRQLVVEKEIDTQNYVHSLLILDNYGLKSSIKYTNSKGETFTNTAQDILFHVINHSTYHRGQIAMDFRAHGLTPLSSDYIFYKR